MAEPETNLEMIAQCTQRTYALELTIRSIIKNTNFNTASGKMLAEENLRYSLHHLNAALKFLNKINTKA